MKRSIGLRGQAAFFTFGSSFRLGGVNAQCIAYGALGDPATEQVDLRGVRCLPLFVGGIRSAGSSSVMCSIRTLSSVLPGTMA